MKLDADIKAMTLGQAKQALQRARRAVRLHRSLDENSRCWHADLQLYEKVLPESEPAGKMTLPEEVLLRNCKNYIRRQQCRTPCGLRPVSIKPKKMTIWLPANKASLWGEGGHGWWMPVAYFTIETHGYRKVSVEPQTCENGFFFPDRHEDIIRLAERLS